MPQIPKLSPDEKTILKKLWQLQTQFAMGYKPTKEENIIPFRQLETLGLIEHVGRLWFLTIDGEKLAITLSSD